MAYQFTTDGSLIRSSDGVLIPVSFGNKDYQEYLVWVSQGNTADPSQTLDPEPDYISFWESLLASSAYSAVRSASLTDLIVNTITTEFIALLGDAKAGRVYPQALQASIWDLMDSVAFSQAQIDELNGILFATYLDSIYTLTRP